MKIIFLRSLLLTFLLLMYSLTSVRGQEGIFVSTEGDDSNPGTFELPLRTIQTGVDLLFAGDTLFLRGGRYHEEVLIDSLAGSPEGEIVIMAYKQEEVVLDGTENTNDISAGNWTPYQGKIYSIKLEKHIWQLFADRKLQIIARWPDASTHPCDPILRKPGSWEAVDGTWWSKATTWANGDMPGTENGRMESNPGYYDLGGTELSFEGGSVILSVLEQGGDGNEERLITQHTAGSNSFSHPVLFPVKPDKAYRVSGKWFIIEHLNALDQPGEWYYTPGDSILYLWTENGEDPSGLEIRGRTLSHAFTLRNSSFVSVVGLKFFASNFDINGSNIRVEDCILSHPDASRRLLGIYSEANREASTRTFFNGPNNQLINSVIEFTELGALVFDGAEASRLHNNLFHHISIRGMGKNGAIEQVNTYTRNTLHTCGTRGAVKTNEDPISGRIQSFNLFDGFGYLQVPDGSALQVATKNNPGTIRSYNWFLNAPKYGSRWDGRPAGIHGTNHHQVGVGCEATLQVKGNDHDTHNNTCLDAPSKNDIILLSDPEFGGNQDSRTYNNLADKMAGHRLKPVSAYPLPGEHGHNWNGYETGLDANLQVRDVANRDFRPRPGSDLIDAGIEISGITDGYSGMAPDIGAYEFGDTVYWIPGRQEKHASKPIPAHEGTTNYEFVDLMWLEGYKSGSSDVYFGLSEEAVRSADHGSPEYKGRQTNNIFYPGPLNQGTTYYWRIDAHSARDTVKGSVWNFAAGTNANPQVFTLEFQVLGSRFDSLFPLENATVSLNGWEARTGEEGWVLYSMLKAGEYFYTLSSKGYLDQSGTLDLNSDTVFLDTLQTTSYDVTIKVLERSNGLPIKGAAVKSMGGSWLSDINGEANLGFLPGGMLSFSVEHGDYFHLVDSIIVTGDTTLVVLMEPVTGIMGHSNGPLHVWPNPAGTWLHVEEFQSSGNQGSAEIRLSSLSGKTMLISRSEGFASRLDVSHLPEGLYILKISTENRRYYHKIIISR